MPAQRKQFWLGLAQAAEAKLRRGEVQLAPASETLLWRAEQSGAPGQVSRLGGPARVTPAVLTFILLNGLMFAAEMALGGATNPDTLHRLGALEWYPVLARHEYWRLATALFLHYGALHLFFNLYALYVLGPALERSLGALRFSACYLVSGIASSAVVLALRVVRLTDADQLVGASGCVMGIIGAWAGLLLRDRHAPLARQRLQNIALIVVMQTAFDLSTPQVSMAAHLGGLGSGLLLGLLLAPRRSAPSAGGSGKACRSSI